MPSRINGDPSDWESGNYRKPFPIGSWVPHGGGRSGYKKSYEGDITRPAGAPAAVAAMIRASMLEQGELVADPRPASPLEI